MWKNNEDTTKTGKRNFYEVASYGVIGLLGITIIMIFLSLVFQKLLFFAGIIILIILMKILFKIEKQASKEEEKIRKANLEVMFKEISQIQVRLKREYMYYPYYHEKSYDDDFESLIFLHMLQFVHERRAFKYYAELCQGGQLVLYIITEREDNDIMNKKEFAEFPHDLFLKYFEPVSVEE